MKFVSAVIVASENDDRDTRQVRVVSHQWQEFVTPAVVQVVFVPNGYLGR